MANKGYLITLLVLSPLVMAADDPNAKTSYFFINDVNIDTNSCMNPTSNDIEFACHRFEQGGQFAIFSRTYLPPKKVGAEIKPDTDAYFKTTILFLKRPVIGQKIKLPADDIFAFHSFGSSTFPESTSCYGLATDGEIEVTKGTNGMLDVNYKIRFDMKTLPGYTYPCSSDDVISRSFEAKSINFKDLNPWLGLRTKTKVKDNWNEAHPDQIALPN
jgi:hypothetical protein